jgi:hypothetical protein
VRARLFNTKSHLLPRTVPPNSYLTCRNADELSKRPSTGIATRNSDGLKVVIVAQCGMKSVNAKSPVKSSAVKEALWSIANC